MFIVRSHSFNTGNRLVSTVYSPIFLQLTVICYSQLQILYIYLPFPVSSSSYLRVLPGTNKNTYTFFFPLRRIPNCRFEGSTRSIIDSFFFFLARELGRKMGTAGWLPATPGPSPVLYSRSPTYPCKRPRIPASLDARFQCDRPRYFCVDSAARLKVDSRLWGIGIIRGTRPTRFAKLCQRPTYVYIYISEAQVRAPFFLPFLVSPQCFPPSRISGRPLLARVSSNAISLQIEPFIRARIESIEVCCSIEI